MTASDTKWFRLGVSLHTLDPEQRRQTAKLLKGSSVKSVELWEAKCRKCDSYADEMRRLLSDAGVSARRTFSAETSC